MEGVRVQISFSRKLPPTVEGKKIRIKIIISDVKFFSKVDIIRNNLKNVETLGYISKLL